MNFKRLKTWKLKESEKIMKRKEMRFSGSLKRSINKR
jgi:hypothetical protein